MKKISALILALVMIFSFAGCTENGGKSETEVVTVTPERGSVESGVFKNETFGTTFSAGEDWYFLTDAEIAQAMGVAAEEVFGEGTKIEGDYIYDLYCVDNKTSATVSINHENLGTVGEMTDANEYLETVMTQLISTGISSGIVDAVISNVKIGETEVPRLYIELDYSGTTIYQYLIVKQTGTWMTTVTMASLSVEELDEIQGRLSL